MRALALLLLLAGCAPTPEPCAGTGLASWRQLTLFLGRGSKVSLAARDAFLREEVTKHFPAGFTALDGQGAWRNPATGTIGQEQSWVLVVLAPAETDPLPAARAVAEAYKARFDQRSVGIAIAPVCAAF